MLGAKVKNTEIFPWDKVRPECGANSSAVLVFRNVKVRIEAQHSIPLGVFVTC
jgi:hypothetical protein